MSSRPFQCLTFTLLLLPPLLLVTYLFSAFPHPPLPVHVHKSLASLPPTEKSWSIYPEDFYPGGGYASLPNGRVRYWLLGPPRGKKIVLIHGLSIPAMIWKDVAPSLAARGYRVLLYDLHGRGYSDAPQTTYDSNLYTTQLALLMQLLKWDKANIVGVSMGGGIAAAFTANFPHLVDEGVGLIASAGLIESGEISRTAKFMSSPLVQTLAASRPVRSYIQRLANQSVPNTPDNGSIVEIVRIQSAHLPGYNAALSSSLRDGPIRGLEAAFRSEGFVGKRVLILHGTKDVTVLPKYATQIEGLITDQAEKKLITIEGAEHDITVSHPTEVLRAIDDLVSGNAW
ncbi:Alpha/Beta hydrolase protein [Crepidotus variabilis]|uniref:Alpha/Beta hydrolase protein n=1 Tax=Crepidotus variabilis TaxID=179855 RepID=A0A9P6JWH5_9AGAR|nr:Alpha/Beta hydrolase protein [Crepidotus variabilis]